MKKLGLVFFVLLSTILFSSCMLTTSGDNPGYTDYAGYSGYTVGYGYGDGYDGYGVYRGYGGWASSYYAPGIRTGHGARAYYGGRR